MHTKLSVFCILIWFPFLGKCDQGSPRYYVKTWKNVFNGEEIVRLFLATTTGDEHHKTIALYEELNS